MAGASITQSRACAAEPIDLNPEPRTLDPPLSHRVLLSHVPARSLHNQLELIRPK
jgi:hypothetical protein